MELLEVFDNEMNVVFLAKPQNEQLARMLVSAFVAPVNPTLGQLDDIKTAVSEAVTNAIIHGYPTPKRLKENVKHESTQNQAPKIYLHMKLSGSRFCITIKDEGVGIENLNLAMQPMYTSKPELERSGMGFSFMEAFMNVLQVDSTLGNGVTIYMEKELGQKEIDG